MPEEIDWSDNCMNYPHDVRHIVDDPPKGPNYFGEVMYPIAAKYDAKTDTTRVKYSIIKPRGE